MAMLEDLYGHDVDDVDEPDLEQVVEGHQDDDPDNDDNDGEHSEAEEEAPRRVDPTKEKTAKVVKNPQVTLNPKRLTGPRGIRIIENFFENFALQGGGHEKEDLDLIMKKLEHWAHRLYPKFQFDDCIDKIANLGKKKEVSAHVRKIRLNMLSEDDQVIQQTENDDGEEVQQEPILDEFDLLLDQQIALAKSTPASIAKSANSNFDSLLVDRPSNDFPISPITNHKPESVTKPKTSSEISAEQRERMLQNRIIAEEKRLARFKLQQEMAIDQPSQSNETNVNETDLIVTENEAMST